MPEIIPMADKSRTLRGRSSAVLLILCATVSGCYTRLHISPTGVLDRGDPGGQGAESAESDTFFFLVDTVVGGGDTILDTSWYGSSADLPPGRKGGAVVQTRPAGYCIWTRDFLGYPELRCFDSWEEYRFFTEVNSPWWIRDRLYPYRFGDCPPGFHYDPFSSYCRHHGDFRRRHPPRIPRSGGGRQGHEGRERSRGRRFGPGSGPEEPEETGTRHGTPGETAPESRRNRGHRGRGPAAPLNQGPGIQEEEQGTPSGEEEEPADESDEIFRKDPRR